MTWSYSGDPSKTAKDQVRFLIQDTVETDQLLSNEEIDFLNTQEGSTTKAAARGAEILAAQFARFCDEAVGAVRISFSQKFDHYTKLAKTLKRRSALNNICPFAGALSKAQKETERLNEDRVEPVFTRDKFDFHPRHEDDEHHDRGGQTP